MAEHDDNTPQSNGVRVPQSRLSRLSGLGSLATRVAGSVLAGGLTQLAKGQRPRVNDLLLTPNNIQRIADQLARMRGAAMKVGQLISMDAGDVLPEELSDILARLRANADAMPPRQLSGVLAQAWGADWKAQFSQFRFTPIAAASIGQVHQATLDDGRPAAIKVQYPGIRNSIDSDVNNVVTLLNMSGLIPKSVDYSEILDEAKRQLHNEADYQKEAQFLNRYRHHLDTEPSFVLPQIYDHLTTEEVLAMSFVEGQPIETLQSAPQAVRDRIMTRLIRLLFQEMYEFRLMQTDPNFANYQYQAQTDQVVLLDFGATRVIPDAIASSYRDLMGAVISDDRALQQDAATRLGFFDDSTTSIQREAVLRLVRTACGPMVHDRPYDFADTTFSTSLREQGMALSYELDYWQTPPSDVLFIHRKLGGVYMLAAKLRARVNLRAQFERVTAPIDS